jgi:hypothetical protein
MMGALGFVGCDLLGKTDETSKTDETDETGIGGSINALVGTWESEGDSYTITESTVTYDSSQGEDSSYAGTIRYVSNFTSVAGVVIIEYTKAPKYGIYEGTTLIETVDAPGNFIGIYYKDLTSSSVSMGQANKDGGAETTSLEAAKSTFTVGNVGTYMSSSSYGVYSKNNTPNPNPNPNPNPDPDPKPDPDPDPEPDIGGSISALVGTWASEYGDSYTITATSVSYDSGFGEDSSYTGTIRYVDNFTSVAGVIIIEYTKAPKYGIYDDNWNQTGSVDAPGNFIGIYYKDLTSSSVSMGQAYKDGGAETTSLEAAKSTFTVGNAGTYMSSYGAYSKETGNPDIGDSISALVGTWASEYGDSYTITATSVSYDAGYGEDFNYAGTIRYVSNFTSVAGVIIIEYTKAPKYGIYDDNWNQTGTVDAPGNFIGIYYKDLQSSSVSMGQAYTDGGAETTSLEAAKSTFTVGNAGTYMASYGAYSKQTGE